MDILSALFVYLSVVFFISLSYSNFANGSFNVISLCVDYLIKGGVTDATEDVIRQLCSKYKVNDLASSMVY